MPRGKSKATWEVQSWPTDGGTIIVETIVPSLKSGYVWIREHGVGERSYRVGRMDPEVIVQIETIERRKLDFGTPAAPKPKRKRKPKAPAAQVINADGHVTCPDCEGAKRDASGVPCATCQERGYVEPK